MFHDRPDSHLHYIPEKICSNIAYLMLCETVPEQPHSHAYRPQHLPRAFSAALKALFWVQGRSFKIRPLLKREEHLNGLVCLPGGLSGSTPPVAADFTIWHSEVTQPSMTRAMSGVRCRHTVPDLGTYSCVRHPFLSICHLPDS